MQSVPITTDVLS